MNNRYNNTVEEDKDVVSGTTFEGTDAKDSSDDVADKGGNVGDKNSQGKDIIATSGQSFDNMYKEVALMKDDLEKLKYKHKISGLSNPLDIRKKRREIARKLTFINKNKYVSTKK